MKIRFLILFFTLFPFFCHGAEKNFDILMGKKTPAWKYVETPEDFERLARFRQGFEALSLQLHAQRNVSSKIPKIIHFIWLGPKEFPKQSVKHLAKWVQKHPGWRVKFWSDTDRAAPVKGVQIHRVKDFCLNHLQREYAQCVNLGEKAKILAFEILYQEGGIYVDHDVSVLREFDPLTQEIDFFCGLEKLGPTTLSSSIIPSSHLIGARPQHPILKEAQRWLSSHWEELSLNFAGHARSECVNRAMHRTFSALSEGIEKGIHEDTNTDVIFPASFFSLDHPQKGAFALHFHDRVWAHFSSDFQDRMHKKFQEMVAKENEALIITFSLVALSFIGNIFLLIYGIRDRKKEV